MIPYFAEGRIKTNINVSPDEYLQMAIQLRDFQDRKLYLDHPINAMDDCDGCLIASPTAQIARAIRYFDEIDDEDNIPVEERRPILLIINSPGGNVTEGMSLVDTIEGSDTPVYTVNEGQWSSMSFLIGITGVKRFSLPSSTFLLHDGSSFISGSSSKVIDQVEFDKSYSYEIIRAHVLKHSRLTEKQYDEKYRKEWQMMVKEAKENGFIDEVVPSIKAITKTLPR